MHLVDALDDKAVAGNPGMGGGGKGRCPDQGGKK
jgi:hypothetical protein